MRKSMALLAALALMLLLSAVSASGAVLSLPQELAEIKPYAFAGDGSLDEVVLPEGIETIGEYAFADSGLKAIHLPASLTFIADTAFEGCALERVTAAPGSYAETWLNAHPGLVTETSPALFTYSRPSDGSVYITGFASGADLPRDVVFPRQSPEGYDVIGIASGAFAGNNNLRSVTFQGNIQVISPRAFKNCKRLESVSLPEGLQSIGGNEILSFGAFQNCTLLSSVTIPSTVALIGGHAFAGCSNLGKLVLLDSWDCWMAIGSSAFAGTGLSGTLTIPGKVMLLGPNAFKGSTLSGLKLTLSAGLESISSGAFEGCQNLVSVSIPRNITTIAPRAFKDCRSLETLSLSEGLISIGGDELLSRGAFQNCVKLPAVIIPSTVQTIGGHAFAGCTALQGILIKAPWEELSIGRNAFKGCPGTPVYVD